MRILLQRVSHAAVVVDERTISKIGRGYLLLVGFGKEDEHNNGEAMFRLAEKIPKLRLFPNDEGKFDKSLLDIGGGALVVPQFTLYGNAKKGNRPSFIDAAPPDVASPLCDRLAQVLRGLGVPRVETGCFGAHMDVSLCNDGPVTLWLDSEA